MIYELSLEEMLTIRGEFNYRLNKCFKKNQDSSSIMEEAIYLRNCYALKLSGIPEDWAEIKKAEKLYSLGKIKEANEIFFNLLDDMEDYNTFN